MKNIKVKPKYDITSGIMAFESGELDQDEVVELFRHLESTGTIWHLQGSYQRTYRALKEAGLL
jgi:hypothetical protein